VPTALIVALDDDVLRLRAHEAGAYDLPFGD